MSDPDIPVETQTKRHRPSMLAILLSIVAIVVILFAVITFISNSRGAPEEQLGGVPSGISITAPSAAQLG